MGHGGTCPSLLQIAGHGGTVSRRTANKKLTKLYWPSRKRSPKRLLVSLEPKSGGARPKKILDRCPPLRGVVPLMHLRHVPPPPDSMATLVHSLQNRVNNITPCKALNANTGKIVLVTLCIQIEWLFCHAFWCETVPRKWRWLHKAQGHVPHFYKWLGTGGTESRRTKNKKVTKLCWPSRKRLPKRLIVPVEPTSKTSTIFYIRISLGLLLQ